MVRSRLLRSPFASLATATSVTSLRIMTRVSAVGSSECTILITLRNASSTSASLNEKLKDILHSRKTEQPTRTQQSKSTHKQTSSNRAAATAAGAVGTRPWDADRAREVKRRLDALKARNQQQQQQQDSPSSSSRILFSAPRNSSTSPAPPPSNNNGRVSQQQSSKYNNNNRNRYTSNHRPPAQSAEALVIRGGNSPPINNNNNTNSNTSAVGKNISAVESIRNLLLHSKKQPQQQQQSKAAPLQEKPAKEDAPICLPTGNAFSQATREYQLQQHRQLPKTSSLLSSILKRDHTRLTNSNKNSTATAAAPSHASAQKPDELIAKMRKNLVATGVPSISTIRNNLGSISTTNNAMTRQQQQTNQQSPLSAALPLPSTSTSTATNESPSDSPFTDNGRSITDIIRSMQENKQKDNQQSQEQNSSFQLTGQADGVTPKWRQPDYIRQRRNQHDSEQRRQQQQQQWVPKPPKITHRAPLPSELQPLKITIPNFDLSLAEASTVFRVQIDALRSVLEQMGLESPRVMQKVKDEKGNWVPTDVPVDAQGWTLNPETLEEMAVLLDLPYQRAVSKKPPLPNEKELLLQRRAAALATESQPATAATKDNNTDKASAAAESTAAKPYDSLPPRPPVVAVMGHVDHGKTTLMDALRRRAAGGGTDIGGGKKKKKKKKDKEKKGGGKASSAQATGDVAGTEAGGITQAISAFQVPLDGDTEAVTFLDTPGHAAFSAMRQSGSDAADILVLVVAADDGVSPQTVEIINFYKSIVTGAGGGGISMVVALNKIDKPGINVEEAQLRVQGQLLEHGIQTEGMESADGESEYGPPVQIFPISALKGIGLDDLIEGLVLQSEVMELRADSEARGEGIVMDARVEKGLGPVVDCIIRWGTIKKGDVVVSGTHLGKVRILKDVANKQVKQGFPSQPIRIIGFDSVPKAGEPILCMESEDAAEDLVTRRKALADLSDESTNTASAAQPELQSAGAHMMRKDWKENLAKKYGLEDAYREASNGPIRIPVIVKADADGSLAAIRDALVEIGEATEYNMTIDPVKVGVGPLLATEVQLAEACEASVVCFNVNTDQTVKNLADEVGVRLMHSDIIYRLLESAKEEFSKYLPPEPVEVVHGRAKVKASFDIGGLDDKVAGLEVVDGKIFKSSAKGKNGPLKCKYRVLRKGKRLVESGEATSLKVFKEDVEEVGFGKECGLSLSKYSDYEEGDEIECFSIEMQRPAI